MPNHIEQQIVRSTQLPLNQVNDAYPASGQPTASGNVYTYAEQLGARLWLDGSQLGVNYASSGLLGGEYQYVQFYASESAAAAQGRPVAWAYDQTTVSTNVYAAFLGYIVTTDTNSALRTGRNAGIALNAVTAGNYGWIQVKGLATVRFATLTGTPADGDLCYVDASSGNVLSANDGVTVTTTILKAAIGVAIGAPVSGALGKVLLKYGADVV